MLVKASIAATALIVAAVSLSSVDFRALYNEMYPVNGLRRDVLGLCHQAEPTFVRAVRSNRDNCYDSMPDPVELAIGWVRTSSRLAAMRRTPSAVELAERLLVEAAAERRIDRLGPPRFTGYAAMPASALRPCEDVAKGLAVAAATTDLALAEPNDRPANDRLANDRLARPIAGSEDTALAALGLAPRGVRRAPGAPLAREPELPVLSRQGSSWGAGNSGPPDGAQASASPALAAAPGAAALFEALPDLGDGAALSLAPRAAAPGCRTPA